MELVHYLTTFDYFITASQVPHDVLQTLYKSLLVKQYCTDVTRSKAEEMKQLAYDRNTKKDSILGLAETVWSSIYKAVRLFSPC